MDPPPPNYLSTYTSIPEEKNYIENNSLYRFNYDNYLIKQEHQSYPFSMLPPTSRATNGFPISRPYYSSRTYSPPDMYSLTPSNHMNNQQVHYSSPMPSSVPTGIPMNKGYQTHSVMTNNTYPSSMEPLSPFFTSASESFSLSAAQFVLPSTREPINNSPINPEEFAIKPTYQTIYRNLFHIMHCKISPNKTASWESCRIYVTERVGYSGNAKRFKKRPEKGERALILDCNILDHKGKLLEQCLACKDYFETQKYFKANPECIGRIVLIKNNAPIRIDNGEFKLQVKMMCCCIHHSLEAFQIFITLANPETNEIALSCKVSLTVKQWRKSNQRKEECTVVLQ